MATPSTVTARSAGSVGGGDAERSGDHICVIYVKSGRRIYCYIAASVISTAAAYDLAYVIHIAARVLAACILTFVLALAAAVTSPLAGTF